MSDPSSKPWLADDPGFLESLGDLDRGLASGEKPVEEQRAADIGPINAARAMDPPRAAPELFTDADDPDALPPFLFTESAPAERWPRHPLIDLFSPATLQDEAPPAVGAAVESQRQPSWSEPPPRQAPAPVDAVTYESFYGLHEKPFSLSTDPRFHYQSASHERAAQEILTAIGKRGGTAVLTAPLGMGKTMLCRALVAELDRGTVTSLALDPIVSINDLLKTMLVDFGVMAHEDLAAAANVSREVLLETLSSFLESLAGLDAGAVLFIDEAQKLPLSLLEDLALVINAPASRVLQLVLVGPPSLTKVIAHRDLRPLHSSVSCRARLGPLAADEISSYIRHRLSIAGANTRVEFDEDAIAHLFELTAGSPRTVNLLCDRALTRGQVASAAVIDLPLIQAAATDLDLDASEPDRPGALASLLLVVVFGLLVIAGGAGALWVFRDSVERTIQQWESVPLAPGGPIRRLPVPLAPLPPPAGSI